MTSGFVIALLDGDGKVSGKVGSKFDGSLVTLISLFIPSPTIV